MQISWDAVGQYGGLLLGLLIAAAAWLYPRQAKKPPVQDFTGVVDSSTMEKFAEFITANEDKVVRLRIAVPMEEDEIWSEIIDDEDRLYHVLSLKKKEYDGLPNGGLELSIQPEKGSTASPMLFSNGGYHLNGFFVVKLFPGIHQGWVGASITELSAAQMALRG